MFFALRGIDLHLGSHFIAMSREADFKPFQLDYTQRASRNLMQLERSKKKHFPLKTRLESKKIVNQGHWEGCMGTLFDLPE